MVMLHKAQRSPPRGTWEEVQGDSPHGGSEVQGSAERRYSRLGPSGEDAQEKEACAVFTKPSILAWSRLEIPEFGSIFTSLGL